MPFQYLTNFSLDEAVQTYLDALNAQGLAYKTEEIPIGAGARPHHRTGGICQDQRAALQCLRHGRYCAWMLRLTFGATETTPVRLQEEKDLCTGGHGRSAAIRL